MTGDCAALGPVRLHGDDIGGGDSGDADENAASGGGGRGTNSITFVLSHQHPGYDLHPHEFTVSLNDSLYVSVANPHISTPADGGGNGNPEAYAKANSHLDSEASRYTGPNSETYSGADSDPGTNPDPNAHTDAVSR